MTNKQLERERKALRNKAEKLEKQANEIKAHANRLQDLPNTRGETSEMSDSINAIHSELSRMETALDEASGILPRIDQEKEEAMTKDMNEEERDAYQHYRETGWTAEAAKAKVTDK